VDFALGPSFGVTMPHYFSKAMVSRWGASQNANNIAVTPPTAPLNNNMSSTGNENRTTLVMLQRCSKFFHPLINIEATIWNICTLVVL